MRKNQYGFGLLGIVVLLLLVIGIGLAGWRVWQKQNRNSKQEGGPAASQVTELKEYRNNLAKIFFKYPSNWVSQEDETHYYNDGKLAQVSGTVTSPNNKKLEWIYAVWGGKGGDCRPNPGDIPFSDGNNCSSKQIYSVEKLPSRSGPKDPLFSDILYITKTKHRYKWPGIPQEHPPTYQICLDPSSKNDPEPRPSTAMGLLFSCDFWSSGFNAKFEVSDEADFKSQEAKTAEEIMRSFNTF